MTMSSTERRAALAAQARQEADSLERRGVRMAGNGYSPVLLVKGRLNAEEASGAELLSGADGGALRAALTARGYAPEDFCALACVAGAGDGSGPVAAGETLTTDLFREAVEALDPELVIPLDDDAADLMREAYADALAAIEDFDAAMLAPGLVVTVLGRRAMALDGFEDALADPDRKRRMWRFLKQVSPAGAPY